MSSTPTVLVLEAFSLGVHPWGTWAIGVLILSGSWPWSPRHAGKLVKVASDPKLEDGLGTGLGSFEGVVIDFSRFFQFLVFQFFQFFVQFFFQFFFFKKPFRLFHFFFTSTPGAVSSREDDALKVAAVAALGQADGRFDGRLWEVFKSSKKKQPTLKNISYPEVNFITFLKRV